MVALGRHKTDPLKPCQRREMKKRDSGAYPPESETIHEATVLWDWSEDGGHPENSLRGFWKEGNRMPELDKPDADLAPPPNRATP
jgi:hypothetical protein